MGPGLGPSGGVEQTEFDWKWIWGLLGESCLGRGPAGWVLMWEVVRLSNWHGGRYLA